MDLFQTNGSSPPQPDFDLSGHGTLYLFAPLTPAAHTWIDEHLPDEPCSTTTAPQNHIAWVR